MRHLENPDKVILDLDPGPSVLWHNTIEAAKLLHKELKQLGMTAFVKTTGGKGLHIVLPIAQKYTWRAIKNFSKHFSQTMAKKYPNIFTDSFKMNKRHDKIYLDYLRNTRGATAIAPYSTRTQANCPISTPLTWNELSKTPSSQYYTIANILDRLEKLKKDPWEGFFQCKQNLP